jgi:hypothetical protein
MFVENCCAFAVVRLYNQTGGISFRIGIFRAFDTPVLLRLLFGIDINFGQKFQCSCGGWDL